MKNTKYHTVGTVPTSNIQIVERGKIDTTNTQIHDQKLAEFLGVERDISFYKELEKTCSFDYMKQNKEDDLVQLNEKGLSKLYRKGE
jgi:hypothetical protein